MREIKFRGRSTGQYKPGLWWEGFYIYSDYEGKHFIVQNASKSANHEKTGGFSFAHFVEVDPETVGQYTGLKDSEGNEIYEGDLVQVSNYLSSVEWDNVGHRWCRRVQARLGPDHKWHTKGPSAPDHFPIVGFSSINWPMTIIGNIHDNPELLNQ